MCGFQPKLGRIQNVKHAHTIIVKSLSYLLVKKHRFSICCSFIYVVEKRLLCLHTLFVALWLCFFSYLGAMKSNLMLACCGLWCFTVILKIQIIPLFAWRFQNINSNLTGLNRQTDMCRTDNKIEQSKHNVPQGCNKMKILIEKTPKTNWGRSQTAIMVQCE